MERPPLLAKLLQKAQQSVIVAGESATEVKAAKTAAAEARVERNVAVVAAREEAAAARREAAVAVAERDQKAHRLVAARDEAATAKRSPQGCFETARAKEEADRIARTAVEDARKLSRKNWRKPVRKLKRRGLRRDTTERSLYRSRSWWNGMRRWLRRRLTQRRRLKR